MGYRAAFSLKGMEEAMLQSADGSDAQLVASCSGARFIGLDGMSDPGLGGDQQPHFQEQHNVIRCPSLRTPDFNLFLPHAIESALPLPSRRNQPGSLPDHHESPYAPKRPVWRITRRTRGTQGCTGTSRNTDFRRHGRSNSPSITSGDAEARPGPPFEETETVQRRVAAPPTGPPTATTDLAQFATALWAGQVHADRSAWLMRSAAWW